MAGMSAEECLGVPSSVTILGLESVLTLSRLSTSAVAPSSTADPTVTGCVYCLLCGVQSVDQVYWSVHATVAGGGGRLLTLLDKLLEAVQHDVGDGTLEARHAALLGRTSDYLCGTCVAQLNLLHEYELALLRLRLEVRDRLWQTAAARGHTPPQPCAAQTDAPDCTDVLQHSDADQEVLLSVPVDAEELVDGKRSAAEGVVDITDDGLEDDRRSHASTLRDKLLTDVGQLPEDESSLHDCLPAVDVFTKPRSCPDPSGDPDDPAAPTQAAVTGPPTKQKTRVDWTEVDKHYQYVPDGVPSDPARCYHCRICPSKIKNLKEIRKHVRRHLGVSKSLECEYCDYRCYRPSNLTIHLRRHTGERPYVCEDCGSGFCTKDSLIVHRRRHTGEKPYECRECHKRFSQSATLQIHKQVHFARKRHVCDFCGKEFSQLSNLKCHRRVHTGETPYACAECGQQFRSDYHLKVHQIDHTGRRPHVCSVCQLGFLTANKLTRHMVTHAGQTIVYGCDVCHKTMTTRKSLREHARLHTGERPYRCSQCPLYFRTGAMLRTHQRQHRLPLQCLRCGLTCDTRPQLAAHERHCQPPDDECEQQEGQVLEIQGDPVMLLAAEDSPLMSQDVSAPADHSDATDESSSLQMPIDAHTIVVTDHSGAADESSSLQMPIDAHTTSSVVVDEMVAHEYVASDAPDDMRAADAVCQLTTVEFTADQQAITLHLQQINTMDVA